MTALVACQVEKIEPETPVASVQGFTLTAGYGDPSSKAAFDAEGLDMKWIPDDILYMIDPNGINSPIKLTTDITEPAKVARFHTDEVLATGSIGITPKKGGDGENLTTINGDGAYSDICRPPLAGSVTIPDYEDEGEWPDE